jgi:8-oxo-dGTP pyrophosphatase MutT (NUDIX family)
MNDARGELLARAAALDFGDPAEDWESVTRLAEAEPLARVPGSLRHLEELPALPAKLRITPAAVLVPLIDRPDGLTILLTRRTDHLAVHAGQISFPGGRSSRRDRSPVETALRETAEEIGLARERVEVLARLDNYLVGTGYRITPVLGLVRPPLALAPDPYEVAEIFEVPLGFAIEPANYRKDSRLVNGVERRFNVLEFGEHYIWGATASILVSLRLALTGR